MRPLLVCGRRLAPLVLATVPLAACGGGGSSPTAPPPTPTPDPGYPVTVTVYYDENGNGQLDPNEGVRIPGVDVVIGSATGKTAPGTGQVVVTGVRAGAQTVNLRPVSLPAYFQPGSPIPVQVPGAGEVKYPVTLPIQNNRPNEYLGLGDSITSGDGSSDRKGYALRLLNLLGPYLGRAQVDTWGRPGTNSAEGASRTTITLRRYNPAYLLILYGTNDWNDQTCQSQGPAACFTIDSLRSIVEAVKKHGSLPVLATLIPVNPAMAPDGRNKWIDETNGRIAALAREENVLLADLNAAFKAQGSLPSLFSDDVHPNDAGYDVMARGWFKAITQPRSASASSRRRFGFSVGH
jgi:lysophospholipase L1-like esterase